MRIAEIISNLFKRESSDDDLVRATDEIFDTAKNDYTRVMLEKVWFRNILYFLGEQYIEYVKSSNTFRRRLVPDYLPTPVSNEVREFVRTAKSLYLAPKFIPKVTPNTMEREDIEGAAAAEMLSQYLDIAADGAFLDEKEKVAIGTIMFGTTFMRTFPQMINDVWMFDKSGNPIKTGDVGCEAFIPFMIYVDTLGDALHKKRWFGIQTLRPREWVEDSFKVKLSRATDIASLDYQRRLMKLVSQVSPWKGAGLETDIHIDDDDLVLFREIEMRPTMKFPQGRYILTCGGKLLKKYDRMPIAVENGSWYYTLTDFHYDHIPGAFWSDSGVNNIISPQNTINEIDQALSINRKGVARPRLISPGEVGLKKIDSVGGIGASLLVLQYEPMLSGGKAPEIHEGTPLPQQVLEERAIQRGVIQDLGGDPKNVLRGNSPGSKASGLMVDILRETAERGHQPDVDRFLRSLTKVYKKRLLIAKEIMTEMRMVKCIGKGNDYKLRRFTAADLRGNTDIRLELDSGLATTNAGKAQILLDFAQYGLFGDITQNNDLRQELLRRVGMSGFTDQENPDYMRAQRENSKISAGELEGIMLAEPDPQQGMTPDSEILMDDPLFKYDNHQIHYEVHRKFIISPEFLQSPPEIQTAAIHHCDIHNMQVQMAAQAQKQEALAFEEAGAKPMLMAKDMESRTKLQGKAMDNQVKTVIGTQKNIVSMRKIEADLEMDKDGKAKSE